MPGIYSSQMYLNRIMYIHLVHQFCQIKQPTWYTFVVHRCIYCLTSTCFGLLRHLRGYHYSKVRPRAGHDGPERSRGITLLFLLTLAVDNGEWLTPRPCRFTLRKETWYQLYRKLDGPQGRSGRLRKILPHRDLIPGPSSL